jgi:crotonobetainyl-CoA:carnitine CoA-transferase CaiB-like acyl-CoA transferase
MVRGAAAIAPAPEEVVTAPLEGIRVVEVASFVAAPAAGALLADLGADVVKVEVPGGEFYRQSLPRYQGFESRFPEAPQFHMDNRGKRSLVLDLTRPPARKALDRVLDRADVLLTNLLPGRLARYALDGETLRAGRPGLVTANLTGFGTTGPEADAPGFDYTAYWARTGLMDQMREPGAPPVFLRPGTGDHAASLALVTGILAALRVRDRTGEGQSVGVSLQHIGLYVLGNDAALALATGEEPPRHDRARARNPLWNHYRTADDRWLFLVMIDSEAYWQTFCRAMERSDWAEDSRFESAVERYRNREPLCAELAGAFGTRSLAHWETALTRERLIWAPVRTLTEALQDEQARATDVFSQVEHPKAGRFESIRPPITLSRHPMTASRPGPDLGADSRAVLAEAGLSAAEIEAALPSASATGARG